LEDEKEGSLRGFYITAAMIFLASAEMDVEVGTVIGFLMLVFTGLAHIIFKIVRQQNEVQEVDQISSNPVVAQNIHTEVKESPSNDVFWSKISETASQDEIM
jgi:hypothetical protein